MAKVGVTKLGVAKKRWQKRGDKKKVVRVIEVGLAKVGVAEVEMTELRRQLVPRTVTLLHTLLHTTGQFSKSIGLADLVASEQHFLYSAFSQQDMTELLTNH